MGGASYLEVHDEELVPLGISMASKAPSSQVCYSVQ